MKEPYGEGLATHIGPESCGAACEGGDEALTGERAGRVFSRESTLLGDTDAVEVSGRLHRVHRHRGEGRSASRRWKTRLSGSVRGAVANRRPYRNGGPAFLRHR